MSGTASYNPAMDTTELQMSSYGHRTAGLQALTEGPAAPTAVNNPARPRPALALPPPILHLILLVMSVAEGKPEQIHKSSPQDAGSQEIRFMREEVIFFWNCRREQLITQFHSLGTTASLGTKPLLFLISGKERGATGAERGGTGG